MHEANSNFFSCYHLIDDCPSLPAIRETFGGQAYYGYQYKPQNYATYGNTSTSSWRNHLNLFWGQNQEQNHNVQTLQISSSLEQAIENLGKKMQDFVAKTRQITKKVGDTLGE